MRISSGRRLLLAVLMVTACSTLGLQRFQDPTIELDRVLVRSVTLSGGMVDVGVRVFNPNGHPIRATEMGVNLRVAGVPLGEIHHDQPFELPKHEAVWLTFPLEFQWRGVGAAARSALTDGRVAYALAGTVRIRTHWGERTVPFRRDGMAELIPATLGRSAD